MLRLLIVSFLCLFLIKNSYSQKGFIIDSVRYTCLIEQELDSVLVTYYHLDECKEVSDTLRSQIVLLNKTIDAKDNVIAIASNDSTIQSEMNVTLKATNTELEKGIKKEKRKSFFKGAGVGIATILVIQGAIAAYFLFR